LRGDKRPGIGGEVPTEGVLRVDLHGLNRYKARDYVEDMIKSADDMSSPPTYLLFIHGYRKGTVMRGVVRQAAERMHKRWDNHPHNRGATYVTL
jgi:DNA-nicking Smr family endonuclease